MDRLQNVSLQTYEALRNSGNTRVLSVKEGTLNKEEFLDKATLYLKLEGFIPYYVSDFERRFYKDKKMSLRRPLEFAIAKIFNPTVL